MHKYSAKIIAENMLTQVDSDEHSLKTNKWDLLIKWKDQSESWTKLADMKAPHPMEVAEYAQASNIDKEPAFAWWVPHTLHK